MMVWTDERMDDLAGRVDAGFTRVDDDIRGLRSEIKDLRVEMHAGFKDLRVEMYAGFKDAHEQTQSGLGQIHAEVAELRSMMFRFGITMMAAMIGLIATLMAAIVTGSFIS